MPSRTEAVAEAIERAIFDGVYTPGDRLVERELAATLGVSKTPVREALRDLVARGIVVNHPYRGVRVREIAPDMIRNLYGVRLLLEPPAVKESVDRHDGDHLALARAALERGAAAAKNNELGGLVLANREFHRRLSLGCMNSLLLSILDDLRDQMALITVWDWSRHSNWSQQAKEHERILQAAERGDGQAAADALEAHMRRAMSSALREFDAATS
ncbi:MAG: GntR family transcriptional regulator [Solirubrobacteraceae bacterium]